MPFDKTCSVPIHIHGVDDVSFGSWRNIKLTPTLIEIMVTVKFVRVASTGAEEEERFIDFDEGCRTFGALADQLQRLGERYRPSREREQVVYLDGETGSCENGWETDDEASHLGSVGF